MGIARCLTFGGARGRVLYDPAVPPRDPGSLTKEAYQVGCQRVRSRVPLSMVR